MFYWLFEGKGTISSMQSHSYLSSYLTAAKTPVKTQAKRLRRRARIAYALAKPWLRSSFSTRIVVGITMWFVLFGSLSWAVGQHNLTPPHSASHSGGGLFSPSGDVALADSGYNNTKLTELPTGPTGQLLPPGTMAAPYTFSNSYSRGQCTWYVAGRRQIPGGWGNAVSWFSRARSAGWSTGTTPAIAAIAWTSAGTFGHVALVEAIDGNQVLVSEMNYRGAYIIDKRWVSATSFKYIY